MSTSTAEHIMATARADAEKTPFRRRCSLEYMPPSMSELRVVLLGNNWSERRSVGNFILGETQFNPDEPDHSLKISGCIESKNIVLINTPNLLDPDYPENRLRELVADSARLSDPGPHILLLVLQPEGFTQEQKKRLLSITELYSEQVFNHMLILISESSGSKRKYPPVEDLLSKCKHKSWNKNLQRSELLEDMDLIMKDNDGQHMVCEMYENAESEMPSTSGNLEQEEGNRISLYHLQDVVSGLRIVLLGGSWNQRSSVGNFILGTEAFSKKHPSCVRISGPFEDRKVVVINTPDLLFQTEGKLKEFTQDCISASAPGPHLFLLVLQPEDFNEEHQQTLCRVLEAFRDQSFNNFLILIKPREDSSGRIEKYMESPALGEIIRKCKHGYLKWTNMDRSELLTRLSQTVKDGEHVSYETSEETSGKTPAEHQTGRRGITSLVKSFASSFLKFGSSSADISELRIVLLGKSEEKKTKLGDFIIQSKDFQHQHISEKSVVHHGKWGKTPVTVVKTPDLFSFSEDKMRKEVKKCLSLCPPGPNVLLLLVKPSDFTEINRQTLKIIVSLFGEDSFKHSMVIITHTTQNEDSVGELLRDCSGRRYNMSEENHESLMKKIAETAKNYLNPPQTEGEQMKADLNLVLFGREGAAKTSAAKAILGPTILHSDTRSSECVKHQEQVCGHQVSLVELPALDGKPPEEVMKESFRCVSFCEPEGINAFILVLPLGPPTDEDKTELQIIQKTFSSQINDFIMILFTTELDLNHPDVVNFIERSSEVQDLQQSCGGRAFVLNIKEKKQIPELLDAVEEINFYSNSYSADMFVEFQMEQVIKKQKRITELETKVKKLEKTSLDTCDEEQQRPDHLRIVMIGKTGCGKSSSGNTILGNRKVFKAELNTESVTKVCQKEVGEVDGRAVAVVDTPGLFDSTLSHEEINDEMLKCISLLAPGPHVFLVVMQIGRFTPEEKDTIKLIKEGFGKNSEKFTILLFTGGDSLEDDNMSIDEYIRKSGDSFKKMINDFGGRFHVFNNKDKQNHRQVSELITKIDDMLKENGGSCFTNEMLQEAEAAIKKEMERILKEKEELMKKEKEELERKHEEEMKEIKRKMEEDRERLQQETEKKLKKMKEKIKKEDEQRRREQEERETEKRRREADEEKHRQVLKMQLEDLDRKIPSEKEEKKTVNRELEKMREKMKESQEALEKERKEWWENQRKEDEKRRHEEQERMKELEQQYKEERETYEKKRQEEEEKRREQESEREKQNKIKEDEEEKHRQDLKMQLEDLDRKIQSEQKEKKTVNRELEKMREEKKESQEAWEKERKEWWENKRKEDEKRRREEQERMKELEQQYKEEREMYEKKRQEEEEKRREQEREREKQNKKREDEEEKHRQDLKMQLEDLDRKIQSEQEEKKTVNRKLEKMREEMKESQEAWEKERKEWWEKKRKEDEKRQQEEQERMKELKQQYREEREMYEKKRQEEEEKRREQEEKEQKKFKNELESLQKKHEEEARKKAEEFNEFKEEYKKKLAEQEGKYERQMKDKDKKYDLLKALNELNVKQKREKHLDEINKLVKCVLKKKKNVAKVKELLEKQEKQMKNEEDEKKKEKLQETHEAEISEMIQKLLEEAERGWFCNIL